MSAVSFDVSAPTTRNRMTVAFRIIWAIPHLIVSQVWGYLAEILGAIQWVIVLFTGQRNEGIFNLQRSFFEYYARVLSYVDLLHDEFPPFGTEAGSVPVRTSVSFEQSANRLTCALRLIWAIPALIIAAVLGAAGFVVVVISWFAIVITGSQSSSMWDFVRRVLRYLLRTQAYMLLMTDTYPSYAD